MRFLLPISLALFSISMFGQDRPRRSKLLHELHQPMPHLHCNHRESAQHPALAQQASMPADLADAPSATQQSNCTQKNGNAMS